MVQLQVHMYTISVVCRIKVEDNGNASRNQDENQKEEKRVVRYACY